MAAIHHVSPSDIDLYISFVFLYFSSVKRTERKKVNKNQC